MTDNDRTDFAAFVGIDWADEIHALCLVAAGSEQLEHRTLQQTPEAIDAWAVELRERFAGQPIAVAIEQSRGALIYALLKYDCFVIYPINPKQLARFREALVPSGAKDDPTDAALAVELLRHYRDRLRPWKPDDAATRLIGLLVEDRRDAVALRTRLTNALEARLKQYFPQALELVGGDLTSGMAGEFLRRWPTLEAVQRVRPETLRKFFQEHNCRRRDVIEPRLELVARAMPLTTDRAVVSSAVLHVQMLAGQLRELAAAIAEYDRQIAAQFAVHPDHDIFHSFPGAGAALAPRRFLRNCQAVEWGCERVKP
jgi:transposase